MLAVDGGRGAEYDDWDSALLAFALKYEAKLPLVVKSAAAIIVNTSRRRAG